MPFKPTSASLMGGKSRGIATAPGQKKKPDITLDYGLKRRGVVAPKQKVDNSMGMDTGKYKEAGDAVRGVKPIKAQPVAKAKPRTPKGPVLKIQPIRKGY